jgi:hypothetical protein
MCCVVLLLDNAHPHTAPHTAETLWNLKFDVMAHPMYSPSLTPSDLSLVWSTKRDIMGLSIHLRRS